jgi:diacylglycerol kinase family enzyme
MAALIARGSREQRVDIGRIDDQWFLNVAGFGFDVEVNVDALRAKGWLRGDAIYIASALKLLLRYHGFRATADIFADAMPRLRMMFIISNGRNFGGAFLIAPTARVDDGLLDFISIGDIRGLARLPLFARAFRGAHLSHPKVEAVRAAAATLRFDAPPVIQVDGDLVQSTSATVVIGVVPGALRVLVG